MPLRLNNSLSRAVEPLAPPAPGGKFRLYCCGPTVYGPAHIGNFRTFLAQDVLRRALEIEFGKDAVLHARNITDVDDKTIRQSQAEGRALAEFTADWTACFHADCAALNMLPPHAEPGAVAHIGAQIEMIQRLVAHGHAYRADDGSVYFKVASFPAYGQLSRLDLETLRTQERSSAGRPNNADEYTREAVADFALWKARKPEDGPNFWPSPWGEGRPGWHIECSAMIEKIFGGETIDLHGGGVDLLFPHHENEIAQSCCAHHGETGYGFARHWFHSAHLLVDNRKMSKSLGNLYTLADIEKKGYAPVVLRYGLLAGHYRAPLNFSLQGLESIKSAFNRIQGLIAILEQLELGSGPFEEAPGWGKQKVIALRKTDPSKLRWGIFSSAWEEVCNDLNIPGCLGKIFENFPILKSLLEKLSAQSPNLNAQSLGSDIGSLVSPRFFTEDEHQANLEGFIKIVYHVLGLDLWQSKPSITIPPDIAALAAERWAAKQARDFARADTLRKELEARGWKVLDRKDGYSVEPGPV